MIVIWRDKRLFNWKLLTKLFRVSLVVLPAVFILFTSCKNTSTENTIASDEKPEAPAPISIKGLQNRNYPAELTFEREGVGSAEWSASIWSYYSDSLKVYTLVNIPKSTVPEEGFPVLIFGHGFHPEPLKYGVSNQTGYDWRPGDYYRGIPEAYAEKGFVVLTPDYRGHNVSDGFEYTQTSFLASTYYAIDVLHLLTALDGLKSLNKADLSNVFYLGHSMGGEVGLKMLLATNKIKAASIWSGVSASTWEQALYYGKYYDQNGTKTDNEKMKTYMTRLDSIIQQLGFAYAIDEGDAIHFLEDISTPLIIHHGKWEASVPYIWSESLAANLYKHGKTFEFYAYDTKNHLFSGENRIKAVERDTQFFRACL